MIEILAYCATRQMFIDGMTSTYLPDGRPLCTHDESGNLEPADGVVIDEIGPIHKADGSVIEGHHVNLRAVGPLAEMLTDGLSQTGTVFERTHILSLIPGMTFVPITEAGVPEGYEGPNGVRLFDPAAVSNRARVWL